MNKPTFVLLLFMYAFLPALAQQGGSVNMSRSTHNDKGKITISENDGSHSVKIEISGDIIFNDEETAIKDISRNGYIKFKEDGRKLTAEAGDNGNIYYTYDGGPKTLQLDEAGRQFLAKAVKTLIGHGVGAAARVERLYKKGGTAAVLNETALLKSDYVKSLYFEYLLKTNSLKANELTIIADKIALLVGSDYEKSKLLRSFSAKYLADPATAAAYLNAVKGIGSDYEKAGALKNALQNPLTGDRFAAVISVVTTIGSDYEKAGVLEEVLENNNKLSDEQYQTVLAATATIGSDYEKAGLLKSILQQNIPDDRYEETLAVVGKISSDYEKASVLNMLAENKDRSEKQWIQLIKTVAGIGSDYEKSNVLVKISNYIPGNDNIRSAYMDAAKSISSEYELGKVVKALRSQ